VVRAQRVVQGGAGSCTLYEVIAETLHVQSTDARGRVTREAHPLARTDVILGSEFTAEFLRRGWLPAPHADSVVVKAWRFGDESWRPGRTPLVIQRRPEATEGQTA
jgi:hypothetical protein